MKHRQLERHKVQRAEAEARAGKRLKSAEAAAALAADEAATANAGCRKSNAKLAMKHRQLELHKAKHKAERRRTMEELEAATTQSADRSQQLEAAAQEHGKAMERLSLQSAAKQQSALRRSERHLREQSTVTALAAAETHKAALVQLRSELAAEHSEALKESVSAVAAAAARGSRNGHRHRGLLAGGGLWPDRGKCVPRPDPDRLCRCLLLV